MSLVDLSKVKESDSFEALPGGQYRTIVEKAEVKETKAGTGEYIETTFKVLEPAQFESRKLWGRFNIYMGNAQYDNKGEPANGAAKAEQVGKRQLKQLLKMGKHPSPDKLETVEELIGLQTITTIKKVTDDWGTKNEITYFNEVKKEETPATALNESKTTQSDIPF